MTKYNSKKKINKILYYYNLFHISKIIKTQLIYKFYNNYSKKYFIIKKF